MEDEKHICPDCGMLVAIKRNIASGVRFFDGETGAELFDPETIAAKIKRNEQVGVDISNLIHATLH